MWQRETLELVAKGKKKQKKRKNKQTNQKPEASTRGASQISCSLLGGANNENIL